MSRLVGGVFLIEMVRGHIPGSFAYPAGLGDILVGVVAVFVLLSTRGRSSIPAAAVYGVAILGAADFMSALFFAFHPVGGNFWSFDAQDGV